MNPEDRSAPAGASGVRVPAPVLDLAFGACIAAGWVWYYLTADGIAVPLNKIDPGPAAFPLILAWATGLTLISIIALAAYRVFAGASGRSVAIKRPLSVLATVCLFVAGAYGFEKLGAPISVLALSIIAMLACGERRLRHLIGVPVAITSFIYGVFVLGLSVNLP